MIRKEATKFDTHNSREAAGQAAEADMAFYLRRAYAEEKDVHVFNDLRIEHRGERAQFDHLVLHRAGMIAIESKSVTTSVRINERGEWSRLWAGEWTGMPSPLKQAEVQFELLWPILNSANTQLLGKMLGTIQRGFGGYRYDVFAAVSTNGMVERPDSKAYPDVCKADQVCEKVSERINLRRSRASAKGMVNTALNPLNWSKWDDRLGHEFSAAEFEKVSDFLLSRHVERKAPPAPATPATSGSLAPVTSEVLVVPGNVPPKPTEAVPDVCADCPARLTLRVAEYCLGSPRRFGGRAYCMTCQKNY